MHLNEIFLAGTANGQEVLIAGAAAAAAGTAIGLYKLDYERIPQVGVLSSVFFVVSLIHVPLGPTSVHLMLGGLLGLVLGWAAFPAVLIALLLQAVFFSMGGLTALGINTLIMALPGVICYYLFRRTVRLGNENLVFLAGLAAGATAILLGALIAAGSLFAAGKPFEIFGQLLLGGQLLVAPIEGLVTGSVVVLLRKVRPELLEAPLLVPVREEVSCG